MKMNRRKRGRKDRKRERRKERESVLLRRETSRKYYRLWFSMEERTVVCKVNVRKRRKREEEKEKKEGRNSDRRRSVISTTKKKEAISRRLTLWSSEGHTEEKSSLSLSFSHLLSHFPFRERAKEEREKVCGKRNRRNGK